MTVSTREIVVLRPNQTTKNEDLFDTNAYSTLPMACKSPDGFENLVLIGKQCGKSSCVYEYDNTFLVE